MTVQYHKQFQVVSNSRTQIQNQQNILAIYCNPKTFNLAKLFRSQIFSIRWKFLQIPNIFNPMKILRDPKYFRSDENSYRSQIFLIWWKSLPFQSRNSTQLIGHLLIPSYPVVVCYGTWQPKQSFKYNQYRFLRIKLKSI